MISNSTMYSIVEKRLGLLIHLEKYLDTVSDIFKYEQDRNETSKIVADYVMKNIVVDDEVFYFAIREKNAYVGVTIFSKEKKDYTDRQIKLKLLKKEKVNTVTGAIERLFPVE